MSRRATTTVLACAALALGAAACGQKPVVEVQDIPVGTTYVALDDGFVQALQGLSLMPGPVGSAVIANGSARLPITGGNLSYYQPGTQDPYVQGEIGHGGSGLSLKSSEATVALTDFVVDPGESVLSGDVWVDGEEVVEDAPLFRLDGRTLRPLRPLSSGGAVLEGSTVRLTQEAADRLNRAFDTDALERGLEVGRAKIVVRTQPVPE